MLLHTKLYIPPTRPNLVPRPRLIKRLSQGLQLGSRLTLISAPAGFGKTTLAGEWVGSLQPDVAREKQGEHSIAWLSLDENDNDPARFLSYVIAALNRVNGAETAVGKSALGMLQSPQSPPVEDILISLINDVAVIPDTIILVLDDYHLIDASSIDDALTFLLENLPPRMHLVIATRSDPNLPLARLRARGQLTELRAADLRFSSSEAAEFLNRVMGLNLSAADISALESRTEGWIAGLQLAAISMQGRRNATSFIGSLTGSHHFILDYLVEDVLEQQPESVQSFLFQTAILDRMTGPLCDSLTRLNNGQETLEALDRDNLFIVRLDEERRWYRYHHLFADLLRHRLRQTQPSQVVILHHQASKWYEQNGFASEAIEHAVQAEDFELAAHLIEAHIDNLWGQGQSKKLQQWLGMLPDEILISRPYINIYQARYKCISGQLDEAERTLDVVEQMLLSSTERGLGTHRQNHLAIAYLDRVRLRGRAAATRALIYSYQGDVQGIIQQANKALEDLPREDLTWRSVTAITLGNAHGFVGDMTAAYKVRFEASKECEAAGDIYFIMVANLELAITLREQGRLQQTIDTCRRQLVFADENGLSQSRTVGWLLAIWGETLAELNDLSGAIDRAAKGFTLTERSGDLQMLGWSFMCLIRILISKGDLAAAEETIKKMESIARESNLPPWITGQMASWQARLWLAQNNLAAASRWMEACGLYTGKELGPLREVGFFSLFDYLVIARILLAQGRLEETTRILQHLFKAAEAGGRTSSAIGILLLQALTFHAGHETDRALSTLEQALALAELEGFTRIFVDEGEPMARLLNEALNRGIAPAYVRQLLIEFPTGEPEQSTLSTTQFEIRSPRSEMVEPLSERELEVLQLIAKGLTNREIASRLYLSLNTVKVHSRNIYGKLEVHSRTQAIARCHELGLLPLKPD